MLNPFPSEQRLPQTPCNLLEVFYDAERLVLEFFEPISMSALHVYHSALPFTPSLAQIHQIYAHELNNELVVCLGLRESWNACLRTIPTPD